MATFKKISAAFLAFLCITYLGMTLRGAPNRGALVSLALICGAGAWALWRSAGRSSEAVAAAQNDEQYRQLTEMQRQVIELAGEHRSVLTVTDVVTDLGYPIDWAEHVLKSLDDGVRVAGNVTDEGVIVYEFREVMHRHKRLAAQGGTPQE